MIAPSSPAGERNQRGLGWDIDSSFSANRGELMPIGSVGHTGFTGTSIWIDPVTGAYVVFMSSRLHPDGKGDVTPLRARVTTIAAAALTNVPPLAELITTGKADGRPRFRPNARAAARVRRAASARDDRHRRAPRRRFRAAQGKERRPGDESHRHRA